MYFNDQNGCIIFDKRTMSLIITVALFAFNNHLLSIELDLEFFLRFSTNKLAYFEEEISNFYHVNFHCQEVFGITPLPYA